MNRYSSRYGWMLVLLALGGLWLRIESQGQQRLAFAAPTQPNANESAPLPAATIAVVDIAATFKRFRTFNDEMDKLRQKIEDFDRLVKRDVEALNKLTELAERLRQKELGSEEHKQRLAEYDTKSKEVQARVALQKADLLAVEGQVYYDAYRKVEAATKVVARQRKVNLVVRFNSDDMKREDRNSVLQGVNRPVVFHTPELDITEDIIAHLNQR
ncbi:OmpH family outer membrane protein [Anatilimnocola floriformis]|uniref:OmpH family outer membrane protein n=1 Tax=Anatilimnocola floriformis TaxID=2948575 RepID=UPI0020C27DC7|nr:OmpH family outer membrane protein [Anatilimnocola floriformis]